MRVKAFLHLFFDKKLPFEKKNLLNSYKKETIFIFLYIKKTYIYILYIYFITYKTDI